MRERLGCGPYDARNAFLAVEGGRPVVLENLDCDRGCNPLLEIKQGLGPNLGGDTSMTPRHLSSRVSRFEKKITACRHQRERKIQFYESHLRKEKNQLAQDCETFSFTRVTCEKKNTTCPWIELVPVRMKECETSSFTKVTCYENKLRLADTKRVRKIQFFVC